MSELEAARRELDAKQIENSHQKELLEDQADALTLARQAAERSTDTEQALVATLAALTRQLEALSAGRPPPLADGFAGQKRLTRHAYSLTR